MSVSFDIRSSLRSYGVRIGHGTLRTHLAAQRDAFLLCDARIAAAQPALRTERCITIEADESRKTLTTVAEVIERLRELGANRQSTLVAIGGGIVQDVATFVASTYMRGIHWSYLPTTLLGMVDSCLGGKSSINVGRFKNIAGNYFPPWEIVIDTAFCASLPSTQRIAGLCEAAKICFAARTDAFARYLELVPDAGALDDTARLGAVIELSLRTKQTFVEDDEFDRGVRLLLNFGHTFGHALEAASGFAISHGVAVGIGTLAALDLSTRIGLFSNVPDRARLLARHMLALLSQVPDLPAALATFDVNAAMRAFNVDKKHRSDAYALILIGADGHLVRHLLPRDHATVTQLEATFAQLKDSLQ